MTKYEERNAGIILFVGENVKQKDIKPRFEDGTLKLQVPKNMKEAVPEKSNDIAIEG